MTTFLIAVFSILVLWAIFYVVDVIRAGRKARKEFIKRCDRLLSILPRDFRYGDNYYSLTIKDKFLLMFILKEKNLDYMSEDYWLILVNAEKIFLERNKLKILTNGCLSRNGTGNNDYKPSDITNNYVTDSWIPTIDNSANDHISWQSDNDSSGSDSSSSFDFGGGDSGGGGSGIDW